MLYILPIIIGSLLIAVILGFSRLLGPYAFLLLSAVLIVMPIAETLIQGKSGRLGAFTGLLVGSVVGLALGYSLGPMISEVLTGPVSTKDNIRIDLVLWSVLGLSITASIFASIGGCIARIQRKDMDL